jgi:hypothetical protein
MFENHEINRDFEIKLQDEIIEVKSNFRHLMNLIERSKYILSLESGWDEENALVIDKEIWKVTCKFIIQYTTEIYENYNKIINEPEINPCRDGTIDLSWRSSQNRLLINLRYSENVIRAYYYGDFYKDKKSIKGWINTNVIDPSFLLWMKNMTD